jgi:hypothetical protein
MLAFTFMKGGCCRPCIAKPLIISYRAHSIKYGHERLILVSHEKRIVICAGPDEPHAFDGIPAQPKRGDLDEQCSHCTGYGQWNSEIDLVSHRSKRCVCDRCGGRGWIETGDDLVPSHDIVMSADGYPQWVVRLDPTDHAD